MKVKVIKIANTNKRYEPEFKKRWSGLSHDLKFET